MASVPRSDSLGLNSSSASYSEAAIALLKLSVPVSSSVKGGCELHEPDVVVRSEQDTAHKHWHCAWQRAQAAVVLGSVKTLLSLGNMAFPTRQQHLQRSH